MQDVRMMLDGDQGTLVCSGECGWCPSILLQSHSAHSSSSPGMKHMNNRLTEFKVKNCLLVSGGYREYFEF